MMNGLGSGCQGGAGGDGDGDGAEEEVGKHNSHKN